MELAVGVPGAEGALSPGTLPPSQEAPFSLQPVGAPEPVPLKPKETLAPGATEPFQLGCSWRSSGFRAGDGGVPGGADRGARGEVPLDGPGGEGGGAGVLHRPLALETAAPVGLLEVRGGCRGGGFGGGGQADHRGERKKQRGEARDGSGSGGSAGPESESGPVQGVSVLNGAPRVRSGQTGVVRGLQTLRRPEHALSWRAHRSVLGEIRKVWTNRQEVQTNVRS